MSWKLPRLAWHLIALCAVLGAVTAGGGRPAFAQGERIAPDWTAPHVPGQLLVKLREAGAASAETAFARAGLRTVDAIPQLGLVLVEAPSDADLAQRAASLETGAGVEWSEPNYTFTLDSADAASSKLRAADLIPNDPYYLSHQSAYLGRVKMPQAWVYTTGRPEVVVAILDTGLDTTHPDLSAGLWTNPDEIADNDIDDDGNGFVDDVHGWNFPDGNHQIYDDYGHGTHVTGIAAARINNGVGIAGMAGGATIMPVDVFNYNIGAYEDLIRAMIYATDNGARVINLSLGASSYSRGEQMAVDYAFSHGVVVVAAAGNTGSEAYHYPAAHPNAIAVAATDPNDSLCSFSTRGDFVDVAAPGCGSSGIWSTVPGSYGRLSGTSMATPHVSGLAALILSLNPTLSPTEVRGLIEKNADDLGAAGRDKLFGAGRINAEKALAMVTPGAGPTPTPPPPLPEWPAGCQDLITDGNFEGGLGRWWASGDIQLDTAQAYSGTHAIHFLGGPATSGVVSRTVFLPAAPEAGMLWLAYRIETRDGGRGTQPQFPYDDWFTAEFRAADGSMLASLLRTGNTADTVNSGLPWDRYVYRMQAADFDPLRGAVPVVLAFTARNDGDNLATNFWIDAVRFCVTPPSYRTYLPLWLQEP